MFLHFHQHAINFCCLMMSFLFLSVAFVLIRDLSHKNECTIPYIVASYLKSPYRHGAGTSMTAKKQQEHSPFLSPQTTRKRVSLHQHPRRGWSLPLCDWEFVFVHQRALKKWKNYMAVCV